MDQQTVDTILASIQSLKKVQRVLANKVIKLSDDFKDAEVKNNERFDRIDKDKNNFYTKYENIKVGLDKNSDAIENLENEKTMLDVLIKQIDESIDNLCIKI